MYNLKDVRWCVHGDMSVSLAWGQVNSLAKWFAWWDWGRRKLYMMPCHSCDIYGTWRSKEVGSEEVLKSSYMMQDGKPQGWGAIFIREVDPFRHHG